MFSPTWTTDLPAICAIAGAENYHCVNLMDSVSEQETGIGQPEVSLQYWDHLGQIAIEQKWLVYNPDYATNGWFADTAEYSVAQVTVPVSS